MHAGNSFSSVQCPCKQRGLALLVHSFLQSFAIHLFILLLEITTHQDDEYAWAGVEDPKVVVTTSHSPSSKLKQFAKVQTIQCTCICCTVYMYMYLLYSVHVFAKVQTVQCTCTCIC